MKTTPRELAIRIASYIFGSAIIAFGCAVYLLSDTGNDCFNVFMHGVAKTLHIPYSASHIGINVVILIFLLIFGRSYIKIGTFVSLFIMGPVTDLTVLLLGGILTADLPYLLRLFIASFSLPITSFGLAVIMTANVGIGPNDLLSVFLSERFRLKYRWVRVCVDVTWVVLGWLLGGTAGIMTVAAAFLVGPISSWFLKQVEKCLKRLISKGVDSKSV